MLELVREWIGKTLAKIFGSRNERYLRSLEPIIRAIEEKEKEVQTLSQQEFVAKMQQFKKLVQDGEKSLDDILIDVFALTREAARRTLNMRHFKVQLIGGIVLHQGKIAEMATGEGKTLVATLPASLNALLGKGVHIVTVNDYLARRDVQWMGPIYHYLGLSVACIQSQGEPSEAYIYDPDYNNDPENLRRTLRPISKKEAYLADITYGTNNEFGFDYLRDNMEIRKEDQVQRELYYAIVDEVDNILIDEARTPLIISGPAEESTEKYYTAAKIAKRLTNGKDYVVKEKEHTVILTEKGIEEVEKMLGVPNMYQDAFNDWPHLMEQALKAKELYKKDVDYVIKDGEVIIVDEFTGRLMPGRRWSDNLHQAVEAKENLRIKEENQTLATITLQNYFKMYKKLAGMTGTAATEAEEFESIYRLEVIVIPPNKPLRRTELPDRLFATREEKFKAVIEEIEKISKTGRPVLVGTTSIEDSEKLSAMLKRLGLKHNVLNAKHHEKEALIIKDAGKKGAITISTNMAGRGTDIILGDGVAELGGLHVIGTQRHESRRIDNQLKGRAGRQGDPGSAQFFISLDDQLLRIFAPEWVRNMLKKQLTEGQFIESKMISKAVTRAQKKVESFHFEIRKNLLEYDNVLNEQRKYIYQLRQELLENKKIKEHFLFFAENFLNKGLSLYFPPDNKSLYDTEGFADWLARKFRIEHKIEKKIEVDEIRDEITGKIQENLRNKEELLGHDEFQNFMRFILLNAIDSKWKEHLYNIEVLREGIGLRGYAHLNPKLEYKKEAYELFENMLDSISEDAVTTIFTFEPISVNEEKLARRWIINEILKEEFSTEKAVKELAGATAVENEVEEKAAPIIKGERIGRNEPCPCGSGKKYKKCCLLKQTPSNQ
ncbi:MAG: preprotein translocase subunit SecA [Planctomycetota bacterium]